MPEDTPPAEDSAQENWAAVSGWRARGAGGAAPRLVPPSPALGGRTGAKAEERGVCSVFFPTTSVGDHKKMGLLGMGRVPSRAAVALTIPGAGPVS